MKFQDDGDRDGDINNYDLYRISKSRDYFTSCLPDTQDGEPIKLPIGTKAPVVGNGDSMLLTDGTNYGYLTSSTVNDQYYNFLSYRGALGHTSEITNNKPIGSVVTMGGNSGSNQKTMGVSSNPNRSGLIADLTNALGTNIIALREAIALQEFQELNNRAGNRYFEQLAARYGTINPDLVLQNPEYLGGTQKFINIMPVVQTSATENQETGAGNLTGYGICGDGGNIINKSFGEWGCIIIYGVITTYKKYQQGLHKMWSRFDMLDFMAPEFVLVGDQAVKNKEIYAQGKNVVDENGTPIDELPFGYQERYGEYKFDLNEIHGQQRSNYEYSLDYNHLAEYYTELPKLNKYFDKEEAPIERILQWQGTTEEDKNKRLEFFVDVSLTGENLIQLPINTIPAISSRFSNIV